VSEKEKREFKGIWFPAEVWLDERLTALEKMILMEIDSLDNEDNCYASNEHLAKFCQCSQSKVSSAISKLKKLGYVRVKSFDGRKRILESCLTVSIGQTTKKEKSDQQNLEERVLVETTSQEKKERKKPATFDAIIAERTDNEKLREVIGEFIRMRSRIGKPLTNYALTLRLNKLWRLGSTDDERIAIAEQSVGAGWQDFYELKEEPKQKGRLNDYNYR
jgi:DNA-binding MarR family transcriptional regulator